MDWLRERLNHLGRMQSVRHKYRNFLNGAVHEPNRGRSAECDPMYQILQSILLGARSWGYLHELLDEIEDEIRRWERGSGR